MNDPLNCSRVTLCYQEIAIVKSVFGFVQKQLECIVSHFESVRSIYEDGAPIFASISIDESDWGQPEIRWCNQRGIVGATEFGEVTDLINEEGLEWKYAGVHEEDFEKQMKSSEVEKDLRCMEEQLRIDQLEDSSLSFDYTVVQTVCYITSELLGFEEHLTNFVQTSYEKLDAYVKKNKLRLRFDENRLIVTYGRDTEYRATVAVYMVISFHSHRNHHIYHRINDF